MKWIAIKQFLVCDVFELIWIFDIYKKKKQIELVIGVGLSVLCTW